MSNRHGKESGGMNSRVVLSWRGGLRLAAVLWLLPLSLSFAQIAPPIPEWVNKKPVPPSGANYDYAVGYGTDASKGMAESAARADAEVKAKALINAYMNRGDERVAITDQNKRDPKCEVALKTSQDRWEAYVLLKVQLELVRGRDDAFLIPDGIVCADMDKVNRYNNREAMEEAGRAASWFSLGAGMGLVPDKTAEYYSNAVTGLGGVYVSGRLGGTSALWPPYTWGIGVTGGIGVGSRGALHVGGGVNVYPWNDVFVQFSYGTALYSYETKSYYDYETDRNVAAKTYHENGYGLMLGYDGWRFGPLMLCLSGGVITTESSGGWRPAYSASVGWLWR